MLDIDCHCETGDLNSIFLFTGPREEAHVQGFTYMDHSVWAAKSVFACGAHLQHVVLNNARIDIGSFNSRSCKVFDDPRKWKVTGHYSSSGKKEWNGAELFSGILMCGGDVELAGRVGLKVESGGMRDRPRGLGLADAGRLFMDLSSNRLIIWSGTVWIDSFRN
jgi:hypothetical protein